MKNINVLKMSWMKRRNEKFYEVIKIIYIIL